MKTVLITGGAGGIGREFCKLFAKDQYRVVVFSLMQSELDELGEVLEKETPGCVYMPVQMDLSAENAAIYIVQWLKDHEITLDVLINNVGFGMFGDHVGLDVEQISKMLALNNTLLTQLCTLIGNDMKRRGHGYVLNVASLAGFTVMPYFTAYSASKSYVINFSIGLAQELEGTGVQVSCLCPSTTKTGFIDKAESNQESAQGIAGYVSKKIDTPDRVAKAGYRGMFQGKRMIFPSLWVKLQALSLEVFPAQLIARRVHKASLKLQSNY